MSEAVGGGTLLADRGWYLAIEFGQSSSAKFERAVQAASKLPGFAVLIDESGTCVYRVLCRADQLANLGRLVHLIEGWKNVRCYVSGCEVSIEAVQAWLVCYLQYWRHPDPPCRQRPVMGRIRSSIGCYFAGISIALMEWGSWYLNGGFTADGVFHVDKAALEARLDAWEPLYGCCPLADARMLRDIVAALPETIDPRSDRRWRVGRDVYYRIPRLVPQSPALYASFLQEYLGPLLESPR